MPPALRKYDNAVGLGAQGAAGTVASTFQFALHYANATRDVDKRIIETGAAMGKGFANQKRYNSGFRVNFTADGVMTLGTLPAHMFYPIGGAPVTITEASGAKKHTFSAAQITPQVPYMSAAILYGTYHNGTTFTTPQFKRFLRDGVANALGYTLSIDAAPAWNIGMAFANEGNGAGSETYEFDNDYQIVNSAGANTLAVTLPSWMPSFGDLCDQSIAAEFAFTETENGCMNTGERLTQSVVNGATITLVTLWDTTYARQIEDYVNYLTATTPVTGGSAIDVGFAEGAISYVAQSIEDVAGADPGTKHSLAGSFPSVQWTKAMQALNGETVTLTLTGQTFKTDFTHAITNSKTLAEMTL
jgi:hypothetical protein